MPALGPDSLRRESAVTLFLNIVGHMAVLLAAGIAIVGTTWNRRASGWSKLTQTGRIAAAVAIVGFGVSSISSVRSYLDERERHAAAVAEIDGVWKILLHPFGLMIWAMDGAQAAPDLSVVDRLLKPGELEKFDKTDLRGDAPHHHGPWSTNLCQSTKRGYDQLRQMQTIYVGILDSTLITKLKNVATAYAIHALQTLAPCDKFSPDEANGWTLHAVTNMDEFRRYLRTLRELRVALDEA